MDAKNQIASIKRIVRQKPNLYDQVVVNLANAANDMPIQITGDFLYVMDAPSNLSGSVKFNASDSDGLTLKKGRRYVMPFVKFLLTIAAGQVGTMTLVIGKDAAFDFSDVGVFTVDAINNPVKQQAANNWDLPDAPINVDNTVGGKLVVPETVARQSVTVTLEAAVDVAFGKMGLAYAGGAGAGRVIVPGSAGIRSYTFYHNQAIYAICQAGQNCNVSYEEEYNT